MGAHPASPGAAPGVDSGQQIAQIDEVAFLLLWDSDRVDLVGQDRPPARLPAFLLFRALTSAPITSDQWVKRLIQPGGSIVDSEVGILNAPRICLDQTDNRAQLASTKLCII